MPTYLYSMYVTADLVLTVPCVLLYSGVLPMSVDHHGFGPVCGRLEVEV